MQLGLYGAFGYDLTFQFETVALTQRRDATQRDLVLYLPDEIMVIDVLQHGQSATLGSDPARLLRLLRARLAALISSALPGRSSATGRPANASGAVRLQSR